MSNTDEPYYCSQQINIPPEFPDILKQFTKAAIRTQPADVLAWAAAYFKAMALGEEPPVKERIEKINALQRFGSGLTKGLLKVLHKQLGSKIKVPVCLIETKWLALSLPKESLDELIAIGDFTGDIEWIKFIAVACSSLAPNITVAMHNCCEILTSDMEGGPSRIQFKLFSHLFEYLAGIDGNIKETRVNLILDYLEDLARKQEGWVMPRNFENQHCPNLHEDEEMEKNDVSL